MATFEPKIPDFRLKSVHSDLKVTPSSHFITPPPLVIAGPQGHIRAILGLKASLELRNRPRQPLKQPEIPDFRLLQCLSGPIPDLLPRMYWLR